MKRKKHHYYAEFCPYGVNTISSGDTLMIFASREERDEMIERLNKIHYEKIAGVARAITRKDATSLYRVQDIGTDHERELYPRTCHGKIAFVVGNKRGGALR